jgi:processive 1,2-diacylglycerol beta-glucosyltransferase
MYISEVSGHHSATLAIEKAIRIIQPQATVLNINAFNYTNPLAERVVNRLYMGLIKKAPRVWDYLYDNPVVVKNTTRFKRVIHRFNSPKLKLLFDEFRPQVVACSQAFPCGMVADFKKSYRYRVPLVAVLTDYVLHSYWLYENVDYYIVPSQEVGQCLVKRGISFSKVRILGIPFDPKFSQATDKAAILRKYDLRPDIPIILIMGGGRGIGPIKQIVESLNRSKMDLQILVVTGTNRRAYSFIKKRLLFYKKKFLLFGFVENIYELMSIAKLIITKPGGITTAEALSKGLPMVIVRPIPGQEESNTDYLISKGAAIRCDEPRRINYIVEGLFSQPRELASFSGNALSISHPNAAMEAARLLLNISP